MRARADWSPAFLTLQKKLNKLQVDEWAFVDKTIQNKYCNIQPVFICKYISDNDYMEYRGETKEGYIYIKSFLNYVSISSGETEYEAEANTEVVGVINADRNITIDEIIYHLEWDRQKIEYLELD